MEPPQAAVAPEGVRPGRGGGRVSVSVSISVSSGGRGGARERALAPLLRLAGDLTALDQRVEGGRPEAVLPARQVGQVERGLALEAERGQAVVAAPVEAADAGAAGAAAAAEPRAAVQEAVGGATRLARRTAGDAGRRPPPRHPRHRHVDQTANQKPHHHRQAEGQEQAIWRGSREFIKQVIRQTNTLNIN